MTDRFEVVPPSESPDVVSTCASASTIVERAATFRVIDDASLSAAAELICALAVAQKAITEKYRSMKDPINAAAKNVDAFFKQPIEQLDAARKRINESCFVYRREIERKAREEQERIRIENEARQRKIDEDRRAAERLAIEAAQKIDNAGSDFAAQVDAFAEKDAADRLVKEANDASIAAATAAPVAPQTAMPTKSVATAAGKVSFVKRWVCEIIEPADVPRMYCDPSQTKLNAAVKSGLRTIPGCRIYETESSRA